MMASSFFLPVGNRLRCLCSTGSGAGCSASHFSAAKRSTSRQTATGLECASVLSDKRYPARTTSPRSPVGTLPMHVGETPSGMGTASRTSSIVAGADGHVSNRRSKARRPNRIVRERLSTGHVLMRASGGQPFPQFTNVPSARRTKTESTRCFAIAHHPEPGCARHSAQVRCSDGIDDKRRW